MRFYKPLLCLALVSSIPLSAFAESSTQTIFNKLTAANNWNWQTFNNLPKTATYQQGLKQDHNNASRYYLERQLTGVNNATVTAYGSKSSPNEVVFYSGGWGVTNKAALLKLSDIVSPAELTLIKSNCNFGRVEDNYTGKDAKGKRFSGVNYIDSQTIYQWKRANNKPLYIVAMNGGGKMQTTVSKQGVNAAVIVVPNSADLNNAIAMHGWNKDKNGKKVSCRIN